MAFNVAKQLIVKFLASRPAATYCNLEERPRKLVTPTLELGLQVRL